MRLRRSAVVPAWCVAMSVAIGLPWFRSGYMLAYDMVWVPQMDLSRADLWGLGTSLPRAVTSDAMVALLGVPFDPQLVQRVLLFGALMLAGMAGARLAPDVIPARLATATLAVWNPFVAERLALGQWPLVIGYGGILWLVVLLRAPARHLSSIVLALAATAMSPVTGLMGLLVVAVLGWRNRAATPLAAGTVLNLPWIVAGFLRRDALAPDPAAIGLFEVQPEGRLGRLGSALSLGGIWNVDVVPTSRTLAVVALIVVVVWAVAVTGLADAVVTRRDHLVGPAIISVMGLVIALAGWVVPGALSNTVEAFGPVALLRDGTRWLALLAPIYIIGFGHGVAWLVRRAPSPATAAAAGTLAVVLPIAALPDLSFGVGGRLTPVQYPASWETARDIVAEHDGPGDVLVLPFSAYRAPPWNEQRPTLDPAGRYFDRLTVVNDELVVSGQKIAGEDPRAARIGEILAADDRVVARLARAQIGLVVVDTTAPEADGAQRQVGELDELSDPAADLRVFSVPGARDRSVDQEERVYMVIVWVAAGLVVGTGLGGAVRRVWSFGTDRT